MNRRSRKKALSLILTLVMIVSMFLGLTLSASACSGNWASNIDGDWYTEGDSLAIADADDLAAFAYQVNSGNTFNGKYVYLDANINLSSYCWTPIGGVWNNANAYPPSGAKYFAGTFDGQNHTISGMSISSATAKSGTGLFGYCCGGRIANVTVSGDITVSGSYAAVGGIVGYTNGSIFNCTSNVDVTSTSASNIGGVAGVVENKSAEGNNATRSLVQYCTNNGDITSNSSRLGGVVGATYVTAGNEEVISVDRCTNNGSVYTSSTAYKTFIGGIVGYCQSTISNSINTGTVGTCTPANGRRMGGVVGILNGYSSIYAKMANCVNLDALTNAESTATYDGALCYDEGSSTIIRNSFWENTCSIDQTVRGTGTNVWELTPNQLQRNAQISGQYIEYYLNDTVPWDWAGITGDAFTCTAGYYPYITNSASSSDYYDDPESLPGYCNAASSCTEPSGIYYDPDYSGGDDDGSFDKPYHIFSTAVGAGSTIVLKGAVASAALSGVSLDEKTIKRSCSYNGYLFDLDQSWNANSITLTIDGNSTSAENKSLINVTGNQASVTVTLGSGVTLQNNKAANNGAAIRMLGGTVNMYGAITANSTFANGGGVAVMSDPVAGTHGIFNLYGTIGGATSAAGNRAYNNGGGIYVGEDGEVTVDAGANITYNQAILGGPGYVTDTAGTVSIDEDATISNNTPDDDFYVET